MPIKYIPFIPEPVEGQAVLGNFNRILRYKGADELSMTLQRGMPLYEMEKQETVGENTGGNMVIRGECVSACAYLKEQGIQVDLVYIDPPFASGADYAKKVYIRRNPKVAEAIAQAERELDVDELKAFEEKLAKRPFARCNSGYLVNLAQVKSVQQGMVQVGPYELQVSRPRRKAFLAALADHIGGEGA